LKIANLKTVDFIALISCPVVKIRGKKFFSFWYFILPFTLQVHMRIASGEMVKKDGEREKKTSYLGLHMLQNVLRFTPRFSLHFPLSPHMVCVPKYRRQIVDMIGASAYDDL